MKNSVKVLMTFCVLIAMISPVLADDINPPQWRGQLGTTFQMWEFSTPNLNPMPEPSSINPYALSPAQVIPKEGDAWRDILDGEQGVWPLSGSIFVPINNVPKPNPDKFIWIQLTWKPEEGTQNAKPFFEELENPINQEGRLIREIPLPTPNSLGWMHTTYEIALHPNPVHEMVKIGGEIYVSELVIDTICVPEPSTIVLLAMGIVGTAVVYIRRKR